MSDFDEQWLDIDFTKEPDYIFGDLGAGMFRAASPYADVVPTLSASEIDEAIEAIDAAGGGAERLVTRIYNQGREGSCVANACSQAHEVVQALQFGKHNVVHLSAISLYKRIGRSPSSGAMVSDGLDEMVEKGILPLDNAENRAKYGPHVMPATGFYEDYPTGWQETAAKFAGAEFHVIRKQDELWTALCNQHPVVVGRQGHSICYLRPMRKGNRRVVMYANSWGDWGSAGGDFEQGFGFDSESQIRQSASWAFALRSVKRHQV